jgi:dihydroorotate dehydrogenase (NAD+) catalytic subunit
MVFLPREELTLSSPWINAAGSLGFSPGVAWPIPLAQGAFVTNPISLRARTPADNRALIEYPGGYLLHTGVINPGLSEVIRRYAARWARAALPVWVYLLAESPESITEMVRALEGLEGVAAIVLSIPPRVYGEQALALVAAANGERPLVVETSLTACGDGWIGRLAGLGVSALSLAAPRGALPNQHGEIISGHLSGPGLFPQVIAALRMARRTHLPLIAAAGVYFREQGEALLKAGAWAVALDGVLWRGWEGE